MQFLKWSFVTLIFVIVLVLTVYFNGYEYSWPRQENNGPGKLINGKRKRPCLSQKPTG
jgi:hypothetical protein